MSKALATASPLKPEIRLAQAVSEFEADLSADQKAAFRSNRSISLASPPSTQDVMRLTAEIDRASGQGGRCLGPRFTNVLQAIQKFAALGDIIIGGSQNLVACGVWTIVRTSLLLITSFSSYLEKLSMLFMTVGLSAHQFEKMGLLYPKSRILQSRFLEYFILVTQMCRDVVNFTRKSQLQKLSASIFDSDLARYQADLQRWGKAIKDEVKSLTTVTIEEEAEANSHFRGVSARFFKTASHQQKLRTRQRVLEYCSEYDPTTVWKQIRKAGNTNRFRQSREYQDWKSRPISGTLIYAGKLGSGKSVLLANIVDDLHLQNPRVEVAFFFCRYDMPETLKAQNILDSIARQILSQVPDIAKAAEFFEGTEGLERSERLYGLIQSVVSSESTIFAVIDGIDELDDNEREILLQQLRMLQNSFTLLICISHRQDANSPLKFDPDQLIGASATPMPENTTEIQDYIENELKRRERSSKLIVGDRALLLEIKEALVQGSQGMFLWVALQMEALCEMQTDKAIREALDDLPVGLSETFRRILQSSVKPGNSYQRPILELITVAQRPLSLEELREALSVTPGNTNWDPSCTLNNIHRTLACCGSLVIIDEEQLTLSFVHHSVKQYLLGDFQDPRDRPITEVDGHKRMSEIIVTYLNYSAFDRQISTNVIPEMRTIDTLNGIMRSTHHSLDGITTRALRLLGVDNNSGFNMARTLAEAQRKRPRDPNQFFFREYAHVHWAPHIVQSLPLRTDIMVLFQKLWEKQVLTTMTPLLAENSVQLLALAVGIGLNPLVKSILETQDLNINEVRYSYGRTVLHMAVLLGSTSMPILLLEKNYKRVDFSIRDDFGMTAIDIAHKKNMFSLLNVFLAAENVLALSADSDISAIPDLYLQRVGHILLESAALKLPRNLTNTHYRGVLVREVADECCELEGSPAESFGIYRGETFREVSSHICELEGDIQWPQRISNPSLPEIVDDHDLAESSATRSSEEWKVRLVEAQYLALSTQENIELMNEDETTTGEEG
ncbi:NACHT nucleoside triphosphatase [Penicillium capsulatum]|uniref:NACHT nucleoside triphosphatase n=1 Tax=Penicillium capsulatum TaxID=69766 RepID=A0A9W9HWU8_9EURO|nr:NACHT nucleoside triphosphatase [Penicillium capsulatum]KAJ6106681.1 NACHT nucleoside triphosphatase [Penicillium capsulatum]